jgi:dihydroflavonol-4-reductase
VHVSSLAAIGPAEGGVALEEDAVPHPLTHYGKSKLAAEQVVRELAPDAVIVRPPVVYGPRDTDVFQLLKSISKGLVLELAGGERWFSAIYVKDLVDGLLAAVASPRACGRSYFLAHAKPASWGELEGRAAAIMGRTPRIVKVPYAVAQAVGACGEVWARLTGKPGIVSREKVVEARCRLWTCDTRRASAELGFAASTGLEMGLAATLAWYKEAGWLTY